MSTDKKLRTAIYNDVQQICKQIGTELNLTYDEDSMNLIGELVWKKLSLYGSDLEAFQKHSKRTTVTVEDVKLLVRRNDSLKTFIDVKSKTTTASKSETTTKRKRKGSTASNVITID